MAALGGLVEGDPGLVRDDPGGWPASTPMTGETDGFVTPAAGRGVALRKGLLAELLAIDSSTLVTVCAPAGFGKSTVLMQWADVDARPFPWLTLTESHNDRARLLCDLAAVTASLRAGPVNGLRLLPDVASRGAVTGAALSVEEMMAQIAGPFVLVLDDAHVLSAGWAVIEELIASVPDGSMMAIASRGLVPIRTRTTRPWRPVVEITDLELAFDAEEAHVVLGPDVSHPTAQAVVDRYNGWPVGISLTRKSFSAGSGYQRWNGTTSDRDVMEYLRREILEDLDGATRTFLTRTAVLGELSGASCDAVGERTGSGQLLAGWLSDNLLVTPVPGGEGRFECNPLLRRALLADLSMQEPEVIPELHGRASRWLAAHGRLDAAVEHAKLAGDMTQLANLIWPNVQHTLGGGGITRLRTWLDDVTDAQIGESPDLIAAMAWFSLWEGRVDEAVRWQALAEAREGRDWRSEIGESERRGVLTLLRAWRGADGPLDMYLDSSAAFDSLPADSAWRASAGALSGIALAWSGRGLEARARLTASEELARAVGNPAARADCLAALGCLAFEEGDQHESQQLILRARTVLLDHHLIDLATSAFAVSVVAVGLARAGRAADAREMLNRSLALNDAMTGCVTWLQVNNTILQVNSCLLIGDNGTARRLSRRAKVLLQQQGNDSAGAPALRSSLLRAEALLALLPVDSMYGSLPLTVAESRILQLLPTHLSFPEMGALLFNSRHTVKTQALAVYRKLGATNRSDAVKRAQALGYLPAMMIPDSLAALHGEGGRVAGRATVQSAEQGG